MKNADIHTKSDSLAIVKGLQCLVHHLDPGREVGGNVTVQKRETLKHVKRIEVRRERERERERIREIYCYGIGQSICTYV